MKLTTTALATCLALAGLGLGASPAAKAAAPEPPRALPRAVPDDTAAFAAYRQEAAAWRALSTKPALPEAARRYKVLAEDALQGKEFEAALEYYEQGLAVDPLWPDGRFNAALLCGELRDYARAAFHIRRYLELLPEAADAPAARDKLIVWEEKARRAASQSARQPSPAGGAER